MIESLRYMHDFGYTKIMVFPVSIALIGGAVLVAKDLKSKPSAEKVFTHDYTDTGKCLADTPYDPSNGAQLLERDFAEADRLTVVPEAANSYTPSVLSLVTQGNRIYPFDEQTKSFLVKSGCIDTTRA